MPERDDKRVVLAVDDHPSILRFIQVGLEMRNIEVVTATSGKRAIQIAASTKPDVIVLDVMMPDMDGFEVLRKLRQESQIPIIVISADNGTREKALQLGANEFVPKPFDTDELVRRIRGVLGDGANQRSM